MFVKVVQLKEENTSNLSLYSLESKITKIIVRNVRLVERIN